MGFDLSMEGEIVLSQRINGYTGTKATILLVVYHEYG